jgi:hypothetical protein
LYATSLDAALRAIFETGANPAEALQAAEQAVREGLTAFGATATPAP